MKKQGTGNREQRTGEGVEATTSAETDAAVEVKPKARTRKKKEADAGGEVIAAAQGEIAVEAAIEAPVEETAAEAVKPAKKAAKKSAKKDAVEAAPVAEPVEPAIEAVAEAPKPKKAAKVKKEKGRDLVVDEPGAAEVAAVLGEYAAPAAAEAGGEDSGEDDAEPEIPAFKGPEPKLERLQKILAKAGISSRRKAEELILGGQVQINGKVVMELGTKADPSRDHIRVNGKLLQGPERIRYFVLNKPKGYVTTVSDPENRPTVMQFFAGERERLYPVGRLDYLSEGLLLVTNDGELANKLTKASSGVEKTYLVKVAGQPTEDMLDALREGVVIEKGRPGTHSGRVRTAPAKIRQVRQGDNPWYEVIIIEGRNRELRKMFEEIGHHVEKIRRVGYGPLILDLEPGKLRELEAEEVHALRLASEGKLKTRRRRGPQPAQLPTVAGKTVRYKKADGKPGYEPRTRPAPRPEFQTESPSDLPVYKKEFKSGGKAAFKPEFKKEFKPGFKKEFKPGFKKEFGSSTFKSGPETGRKPAFRPGGESAGRPPFAAGSRPAAGGRTNFAAKPRRAEPPVTDYVLPPRKSTPEFDDPKFDNKEPGAGFNPDYKPGFRTGGKPAVRPAFRQDGPPKRFGGDKPFKSSGPRKEFSRPAPMDDDDWVPTKTPGFKIEPVEDSPRPVRSGRPNSSASGGRSFTPRSGGFAGGGKSFRPASGRPAGRAASDGPSRPPRFDRPREDRPQQDRPFRPRTDGPPAGGGRPFRPKADSGSGYQGRPGPAGSRPARTGPPRTGAPRTGEFRPRGEFRPGSDAPARRSRPAEGGDAPREFRPRKAGGFGGAKKFDGPKKFGGAKPFGAKRFDAPKPAPGGRNSVPSNRLGPDGQPRIKERARNSFTGKNKGRPKPRPKAEE